MKRGDISTVAIAGDFDKPCPSSIIQADHFIGHTSITVLLMTNDLQANQMKAAAVMGLRQPDLSC